MVLLTFCVVTITFLACWLQKSEGRKLTGEEMRSSATKRGKYNVSMDIIRGNIMFPFVIHQQIISNLSQSRLSSSVTYTHLQCTCTIHKHSMTTIFNNVYGKKWKRCLRMAEFLSVYLMVCFFSFSFLLPCIFISHFTHDGSNGGKGKMEDKSFYT